MLLLVAQYLLGYSLTKPKLGAVRACLVGIVTIIILCSLKEVEMKDTTTTRILATVQGCQKLRTFSPSGSSVL